MDSDSEPDPEGETEAEMDASTEPEVDAETEPEMEIQARIEAPVKKPVKPRVACSYCGDTFRYVKTFKDCIILTWNQFFFLQANF